MSAPVVTESELQAYVDGCLPASRMAEVESYLAQHENDVRRIAAYRQQDAEAS